MKEKKGISLIVLIVTIIVMIIIAGAVIISLTETNIIDQAEVAVEKHNLSEMKAAASMAYSNWLANKHLEGDDTHVQNYIRNELINQGIATWDDFSKWYVTPTGGIEEIDQEAFTYIVEIPASSQYIELYVGTDSTISIDWGDEEIETIEGYEYVNHEYEQPGIYEIKINGELSELDLEGAFYTGGEKIIAIKSLGDIGIEYLYLYTVDNLEYISTSNKNSFKDLLNISMSSASLQEIPNYFFKDCNNLVDVNFLYCTNLRQIPDNLFEGVTDVSSIVKKFPEGLDVPTDW